MKRLIASTAFMLLSAVPAHAQWEPPAEVLQVRISGQGAWTVRCEYQDRKGRRWFVRHSDAATGCI